MKRDAAKDAKELARMIARDFNVPDNNVWPEGVLHSGKVSEGGSTPRKNDVNPHKRKRIWVEDA